MARMVTRTCYVTLRFMYIACLVTLVMDLAKYHNLSNSISVKHTQTHTFIGDLSLSEQSIPVPETKRHCRRDVVTNK